jgi:hypothetical protein
MISMTNKTLAIVALVALVGSACSSGADASADEGVASLEVTAAGDAASAQTEEETPDLTSDEAALAFSACMRENGISFPDLAVGADGNIELRDSFQDADPGPQDPAFRAAMDECRPMLESAGFGGGRGALLDNVEVADALVEFSDCVRDAGYDVGDVDFGQPGQNRGTPPDENQAADGAADGQGEGGGQNAEGGNRQGGFGNIGSRFAEQLGLDPEDPDVIATMDSCTPIITDAMAAAGIGR